jgi:hypothetical protein
MTCSVGQVSPVAVLRMIPSPPMGSLEKVSSTPSSELIVT